jgi:hypothetical protein
MQKCFVTEEQTFTIDFDDSEDAREFYNRTREPFYNGTIDLNVHDVVAAFDNPKDADEFRDFLKTNLEEKGITERGFKIYELYRPYRPEPVRIGEE